MVVGVVLMILTALACTHMYMRRQLASEQAAPPSRELAADRLAGSINRAAYMKEPGDQELVVSRGPDDKDVAMPDDDDRTADDTHNNNINLNPPRVLVGD
jgi:hypothetical protein